MELETALNLLRFIGVWPVKENKSLYSKLIRVRAALSRLVFIFIMTLVCIKWWKVEKYINSDLVINAARDAFILLKEYTCFMFFYRKRKQVQQLICSITGRFCCKIISFQNLWFPAIFMFLKYLFQTHEAYTV